MRLNNMYDEYTEIDFSDAEVSDVKVSLALPSGKKRIGSVWNLYSE